MMVLNDEIRELILKDCSSGSVRDAAFRNGLVTLADDGWRLVREGVTSIEEVVRVAKTRAQDLDNGHEH